jgi:hypothetical protein
MGSEILEAEGRSTSRMTNLNGVPSCVFFGCDETS